MLASVNTSESHRNAQRVLMSNSFPIFITFDKFGLIGIHSWRLPTDLPLSKSLQRSHESQDTNSTRKTNSHSPSRTRSRSLRTRRSNRSASSRASCSRRLPRNRSSSIRANQRRHAGRRVARLSRGRHRRQRRQSCRVLFLPADDRRVIARDCALDGGGQRGVPLRCVGQ